jgi:ribonuclease P protein component|tara:strand:+ start:943 stop:1287 length:345 start_codon:yes stop_codon:yes gene_type:complete
VLRLKQRWQFLRVASTGRKWVAPGMVVQALNHEEDELKKVFRIGYTVSKKVGGAPERNRAKRRLRAAAEKVMPKYARTGHDFVLIGRKRTLEMAFPALIQDLETALKKLDAYNK